MELLKTIKDEWAVISTAPFTFLTLAALMFAAAYFVSRWRYTGTIEELKAGKETLMDRLHLRAEQSDAYREKADKYDQMLTDVVDSGSAELREKTLSLVSDLREFLLRYKREDHAVFHLRGDRHLTDEEREIEWEKSTQRSLLSSMERIEEYNRRFKVKAIILRDELLSRLPNYKTVDEWMYEHPTNNHGLEGVAVDLEKMANLL